MKNDYYFKERKGMETDEKLFWASTGLEDIHSTAKAWPSGKGHWYLARAVFVRTLWPIIRIALVLSLGAGALAAGLFAYLAR